MPFALPLLKDLYPVFAVLLLLSTSLLYAQERAMSASVGEPYLPSRPSRYINLINSRFEETKPVISPDGKRLYFARKHSPLNAGGSRDPQDVYFSETADGRRWTIPVHPGAPVNTVKADNLCGVTWNNELLFFVPSGKTGGRFIALDASSRTRDIGLTIINESDFLEASFNSEGDVVVYTARTRANPYYSRGGNDRDVYISEFTNGRWSEPVNAGISINTPGDEFSPYLASDRRTLYFASDGHGGFGGVDIFIARRTSDSWTEWSVPVNLGPTFNGNGFDGYFTPSPDGQTAFYVTTRGSIGKGDIVWTELPSSVRPSEVTYHTIRIVEARSNKPVAATLYELRVNGTTRESHALSDGVAHIAFSEPGSHRLRIGHPGFIFEEITCHWNGIRDTTVHLERYRSLASLPFTRGSARWTPEADLILRSILAQLASQENTVIELRGHTDNSGTSAALRRLSLQRVETVRKMLIQLGTVPDRIRGKGFGGMHPVADNQTEENRSRNRRVEILLLPR